MGVDQLGVSLNGSDLRKTTNMKTFEKLSLQYFSAWHACERCTSWPWWPSCWWLTGRRHWKLEEGVAEQFKGFGNQNVETRSLLLSDLNSDHFSQVSHKPSQSVSGRMWLSRFNCCQAVAAEVRWEEPVSDWSRTADLASADSHCCCCCCCCWPVSWIRSWPLAAGPCQGRLACRTQHSRVLSLPQADTHTHTPPPPPHIKVLSRKK